jgi:hypothetical protein
MIRVQTAPLIHAETAAFQRGRGEAGALASFNGTVRALRTAGKSAPWSSRPIPASPKEIAATEADVRAR